MASITVGVLYAAACSHHAVAQTPGPALRTAELTVDVSEDGSSQVEAVYHIAHLDTARAIPLRGLLVFGTAYENLRVDIDGDPARAALAVTRAPLVEGTIQTTSRPGPGLIRVRLRYTIPPRRTVRDERFDVTVPLIFVDIAPAGAGDSTFTANVHMPGSYVIDERFPVVPIEERVQGGQNRYVFALQVLPSYVRLSGTTRGDELWWTFSRKVDLGIMVILSLICYLFWRRFKSTRHDPQHTAAA